MIITIDGPSASGKSTLASMIAQKLGLFHLNSGLLFRGMAYILMTYFDYTLEDLANPKYEDIDAVLSGNEFEYIYKNGKGFLIYRNCDLTPFLKSPKVDQAASILSMNPFVREHLLQFQRRYALTHQVVVDGRDTGTIVFPNANLKIFLTATPEVRAERWRQANLAKGKKYTFEESLKEINDRDKRDEMRKIAPLKPAEDAFIIDNSTMSLEQTFDAFMKIFSNHSSRL